jgi:hypothetical protein
MHDGCNLRYNGRHHEHEHGDAALQRHQEARDQKQRNRKGQDCGWDEVIYLKGNDDK